MTDLFAVADALIAERVQAAGALYAAMKKAKKLSSHRLVVFRCDNSRRCLLLDVVQFPDPVGIMFHQPVYKLSPTVNESTSSESGRAANTLDGNSRWKPRTYLPEQAINVTVSCDHVHDCVIEMVDIDTAIAAGEREVKVGS